MAGEVLPLAKATAETAGYRPSRPLGGWLATYGTIGPNGGVVPTMDREGHIFEAASAIGRIDFTEYLTKGLWNDTHEPINVGVPVALEFHSEESALAKAHRKVGFWTEGHLFDRNDPRSWSLFTNYEPTTKDLDRSDYYWHLATMLKGVARPLGFSADGRMLLSPCGKRIIWAKVEKNAVCEIPQNPFATAQPLRLAVPIRADMIGANPCESCRCPPGARCPVVAARKAADPAIVPEDLERAAKHFDPVEPGDPPIADETAGERLIRMVQAFAKCSRDDAVRWAQRWARERLAQTTQLEGRAG